MLFGGSGHHGPVDGPADAFYDSALARTVVADDGDDAIRKLEL